MKKPSEIFDLTAIKKSLGYELKGKCELCGEKGIPHFNGVPSGAICPDCLRDQEEAEDIEKQKHIERRMKLAEENKDELDKSN